MSAPRLVAACLLLVACDRRDLEPRVAPGPAAPDAGARAEIDWTRPIPVTPPGGVAEAGYAGDAACRPCHAEIYARYARHPMARSGVRPLAALDQRWLARIFDGAAPVRHERSGFAYRPFREGTRYFVEETLTAPDGTRLSTWVQPITHALSAGDYGMAFYFRQGDKLYHVPIDFFARLGRWDLDPFASRGNPRFFDTLGPFCISCHSDYPRRSAGVDDVFFEPFPRGIGCERCHGPGARHIETLAPADVVHPGRLSPARQLDLCAQCHLMAYSSARADRHEFSYRPGERLDAVRANFLPDPPAPDRVRLLGHAERLVASACFRGSGGTMTCTTCHDAHTSSAELPPRWWDRKCDGCHRERPCTESRAARAKVGDHCARCHMRVGPAWNVPLVSVTDHFIQRRPPPAQTGPGATPRRLLAWGEVFGETLAGDDVGAILAVVHEEAGLGEEAARLAQSASPGRVVGFYDLLFRQGRLTPAAASAAILGVDSDARAALLALARARLDEGTPTAMAEAERALDRVLALDPGDQSALEIRGMLALRAGREHEARALLARAAAAGPAGVAARVGLAALALREGRLDDARVELEAARPLQPFDSWILEKLALIYERSGDAARVDELARVRAGLRALGKPATATPASLWLPPAYR